MACHPSLPSVTSFNLHAPSYMHAVLLHFEECVAGCVGVLEVWNGINQQQNPLNLHVTQTQEDYNGKGCNKGSPVQATQRRITQSTG